MPALPPALQAEAVAAGIDLLAVYLAKIAAAEAMYMSVTSRGGQEERVFRAAAAAVAETPVAGTTVTPARLAAAGLQWLMLLRVPWTALSPAQAAVVTEYAATTVRLTAAQRRWTGTTGTDTTVVVPAGGASLSPAAAVACLSQLQALGARWPALATHTPLTAALAELATVLLGTRNSAGGVAVDQAHGDGDPRGVAPRRDRASARYAAGLEVVLRGLGGPPLVDL